MARINDFLDSETLPEFVRYIHIPVSREEVLKRWKAGEDMTYYGDVNTAFAPVKTYGNGSEYPDEEVEKTIDLLDKLQALNEKQVVFEPDAGHTGVVSPFDQITAKIDDISLVGWFYFERGIVGWSTDDAVGSIDDFLANVKLKHITGASTSSDSTLSKLDILSQAHAGDMLVFDIGQRNGMVGLYKGVNSVLIASDLDATNVIREFPLWAYGEDGTQEGSYYLDKFNGTVLRPLEFDKEEYKWQSNTIAR